MDKAGDMLYAVYSMAHRTQLHLDEQEFNFLRRQARESNVSMAQVIRSWIKEKMAIVMRSSSKDPLLKARGLFKSGDPDLAENFDDALYGVGADD